MNKIKKGDEIIVITGKDKGKRGKVLRIFLKQGRVLVEGINLVKKNLKPNPQINQQGGIIDREASIAISNVALYNPATKKADKVTFKMLKGRMVRHFKSNDEVVDIT